MTQSIRTTVGVDISDRVSRFCVLDAEGEVVEQGRLRMTPESARKQMAAWQGATVVFETGTHALWFREEVERAGCRALEANPSQVRLIYGGHTKSDKLDAEKLARLGRVDEQLLKPVHGRSREVQQDLVILKARAQLVETRASLATFLRGVVKPFGIRMPPSSTPALAKRALEVLPPELHVRLRPVLEMMEELNKRIRQYDRGVQEISERSYPVTEHLQQVDGVGPVTALAFALVVGNPGRFAKSRTVGSYVGLRPKQDQSGDQDIPLGITRAGSPMLRRLLVQCANYMLGHFGQDSDLRRYGKRIEARGGKVMKRKAVVAVARKLAVLLHRLWVTGEIYDPLRVARQRGEVDESVEAVPA